MNKKQLLVPALLSALLLNGCSPGFYYHSNTIKDDDLVEVSQIAVQNLLANHRLPKGSLVVINSMVNVDDLAQTLPFGRIMSDQLASSLHQAGYRVMGMELPTEIFTKNDAGILQIADKTKEALNLVHAQAVLVGTYAPGRENVYVSLRLVELVSQDVISTYDFSTPLGPDAKVLTSRSEAKE